MTLTDYLLDIGLIAVVLLQVRGRRLTFRSMLIPIGIVAWAASNYLHGIPTSHNNLVLIGGATLIGAVLGGLCALFTSVKRDSQGFLFAKAGFVAAAFWILGTGARLAFQLYATHGGESSIARFSSTHGITTINAWTAALIMMAIGEVVLRTGIIAWKGYTLGRETPSVDRPFGTARVADEAMMASGDRAF